MSYALGHHHRMGNRINRIRYWLTARRCSCRGYPRRFAGGTVQIGGMVHRIGAPCYLCDEYGHTMA